MPTSTSTPVAGHSTVRCLNVPDLGVAPGAATRLPRWRAAERVAGPPRVPTTFPTSEQPLPQADGAA
jgi:hypothetical protein